MDLGLYDHVDRIVSAIFRFIAEDKITQFTTDAGPRLAALSENFGSSPAESILQLTAALVCTLFAMIAIYAVLKKRELAVPQAEATEGATPELLTATPGILRVRWDELRAYLDSTHEADWKVAVIEADKLLDDALRKAGFSGDSFGDRLINITPGTLVSLDGLWWAHKIRNRLAHEADYFLRYTEARQAFAYYEQALAELSLI